MCDFMDYIGSIIFGIFVLYFKIDIYYFIKLFNILLLLECEF